MDKNKDFEEVLHSIRKRPGMYLRRPHLSLLDAFMTGYYAAVNKITNEWIDYLEGFQQWISDKYKLGKSYGWVEILLFVERDDEKAFYKFYKLLEEFKKEEVKNEQL